MWIKDQKPTELKKVYISAFAYYIEPVNSVGLEGSDRGWKGQEVVDPSPKWRPKIQISQN